MTETAARHYPVDPWLVREPELDLDRLPQTESVFALSNGHVGVRGNLDEGEPHGIPGTYLTSFYEQRPLPYAEAGYGYPESGQTVVDVTNGKLIRVLVDDEPLDVRYGELPRHERVLDLRAGLLQRDVEWVSPTDRRLTMSTTRLVSFTHRSIMAVRHRLTAVDKTLRIIVQSELVANEAVPMGGKDPRVAAALESPLVSEEFFGEGSGAHLVHSTRASGLRVAVAMDHEVEGPGRVGIDTEAHEDWARTTIGCQLQPGESLTVTKYVSYGWSSLRSLPALRDQVAAALTGATYDGWDGLVEEQRRYLDDFWDGADVELEGDDEVQQAVRFALFHVLQAGARAEQRAIAAKGLTGPGYDGHSFWDTEMFVLPVLCYVHPDAAADALRWRHSILDLARDRAQQLGLAGAAFPWRTIRGQECSAYWPAGSAAVHVNADVADAALRYVRVTGDVEFERTVAVEIFVETARLWMSLGHHDRTSAFRIQGVTGPDEYSALAHDNLYTNLMAQQNLREAAALVDRYPDVGEQLQVRDEEITAWQAAADLMRIPFDDYLQVHPQSEGFTELAPWDFAGTPPDQYPLLLHSPYGELYRRQVVKQADAVLAMHWRGDAFTHQEKAHGFAYYEPITVRDSSLSACTQAVVAAEVGHLDLAHAYVGEAALTDLRDLARNTKDGLHIASLAGAWLGLVAGFGGMRDFGGRLSFAPRLPHALKRLTFSIRWHGHRVRVSTDGSATTYTLRDEGTTLELWHDGKRLEVASGQSVTMPNTEIHALTPVPEQPAGREPVHRHADPD